MCKFIGFSFFLVELVIFFVVLFFSGGVSISSYCCVVFNSYFMFDCVSFYLLVLVVFLGMYSQFYFFSELSNSVRCFLLFSLVFSIICFCVNHSVLFWCFYELSMLPLLYLIFAESPYSERFLAGWYFASYLLITSLPLILFILYLSLVNSSFFFSEWGVGYYMHMFIFVSLAFIFFTKVPLFPFHTWLPMVHAEATSIVSIFLSGYIMKLGLLGVCRCCSFIFNNEFVWYLVICCLFSVFFFVTASNELDGKRWLAFLSLAHIVVPFIGLFVNDWDSLSISFLYCLGHGVSAAIVFGLLWYFYDISNSRNWLLLKSSINSKTSMLLVIISMLSLCSFPPTIQFFCEVTLVKLSYGFIIYVLFWCFYIFFGGLVPLILCGHLLIRNEFYEDSGCFHYSYWFYLVCLCFWCYFGIVFL